MGEAVSERDDEALEKKRAAAREYMRKWRAQNHERDQENDKKWRAANHAKRCEQRKRWRKANPEKSQASWVRWAEANPEKAAQAGRVGRARYRKAHPEKFREYDRTRRVRNREGRYALDHKRRARKKAAPGKGWSAADVQAQYEAQRGKCLYCGVKLGKRFHRDHITPLATGGAHCRSNLALACADCNTRKHAKSPQEFAGILL